MGVRANRTDIAVAGKDMRLVRSQNMHSVGTLKRIESATPSARVNRGNVEEAGRNKLVGCLRVFQRAGGRQLS